VATYSRYAPHTHTHTHTMNIVEKIKTTKGCYSLTIKMVEDAEYALVSITDSKLEHCIRLDAEDLRRIHLLIGDHLMPYDGEHGSL